MREINLLAGNASVGGSGASDPMVSAPVTVIAMIMLPSPPPPPPSPPLYLLQSGDPGTGGGGAGGGGAGDGAGDGDGGGEAHLVIWGTDVNVNDTKRQFIAFLREFIDDIPHDDDEEDQDGQDTNEPLYLQRLDEVCAHVLSSDNDSLSLIFEPSQINTLEEPFLNVRCRHIRRFSAELYSQLVRYPQEVIPVLDLASNELFEELYPDTVLPHQIQVRQ